MGGRISLTIGIVGAIVSLVIGVLYGGISGYCGGLVDDIMMRIVEILVIRAWYNKSRKRN